MASQAVQRRIKARDQAERNEPVESEVGGQQSQDVPRVLPQDNEEYARTFFFNAYLLESRAPSHQRGYLDCLLPVWTRSSPLSPLRPAINAVALALLEAWSLMNPNSPPSLARSHYVQGVAAVRRRLQTADGIDDDLLLATLLLDMYDGITSFCGARPHEGPHVAGSGALIENRRGIPVNNKASQGTLLAVRSRIVDRALMKRESVSRNVLSWTTSTQTNSSPPTPEIGLEEIDVEVANLYVTASRIAADPTGSGVSPSDILAKANELDQRLLDWSASLPPDWIPVSILGPESVPQSIRVAGMYQDHCTIHRSIFIANSLNGHCCSRIKLQLVILACHNALNDPDSEPARIIARNTIQELADSICATVPYHLGDRVNVLRIDDKTVQYPRVGSEATPAEDYVTAAAFGGMFLMKRFVELLNPMLALRTGQREWVLGQMRRVRRVYLAAPSEGS